MNKSLETKNSKSEPTMQANGEAIYATKVKTGFSLNSTFWSIFIPAYCYFFGYTSFKCQLYNLGFDVFHMSPAPGDVYFQAFVAFTFLSDKSFSKANELMFKHFVDNWVIIMLLSIAAGLLTFFILWWSDIRNKKGKKKSTWLVTLTRRKLMILRASVLAIFVFLGNVLIIPSILLAIVIGGLLSIPPIAMGSAMAEEARRNFTCVDGSFGKSGTEQCSLVTLKNGRIITGEAFHMDDKNLYILTESTALSLPIEQIDKRERKLDPSLTNKS